MSRRRRKAPRRLSWRGARGGPGPLRSALSPAAALALTPTALASLWAAASAVGGLGARGEAAWFAGGAASVALLDLMGLRFRPLYVFAHELTHAIAAWAGGGKVYAFIVRGDSGRVDLSHAGPFVALAPYWVPLYALLLAGAYRLLLWYGAPGGSREAFLGLMGGALAFHLCHTARSLFQTHQSDLDEAGPALSLALIAILNAAVLLGALKCLFPDRVGLGTAARGVWSATEGFWGGGWRLLRAAAGGPG